MRLINFSIHKYGAPPIQQTPFQPPSTERDTNIELSIQFDNEAEALSFASDVLKTIETYRKNV